MGEGLGSDGKVGRDEGDGVVAVSQGALVDGIRTTTHCLTGGSAESASQCVTPYQAGSRVGKLRMNLPKLWASATLSEQRKILITMLDAVYIDAKADKRVVAVMPKPPFRPIFQVASGKKDSKIHIINEPLGSSPKGSVVFLVETGESRTPRPRKTARNLLQV